MTKKKCEACAIKKERKESAALRIEALFLSTAYWLSLLSVGVFVHIMFIGNEYWAFLAGICAVGTAIGSLVVAKEYFRTVEAYGGEKK